MGDAPRPAPPLPGEPAHPEHLLKALRMVLDGTPPPRRRLTWHLQIAGDGEYTLTHDAGRWSLELDATAGAPDVLVRASSDALARFLLSPPASRTADDLELVGTSREVQRFHRLLTRFPDGATATAAAGD